MWIRLSEQDCELMEEFCRAKTLAALLDLGCKVDADEFSCAVWIYEDDDGLCLRPYEVGVMLEDDGGNWSEIELTLKFRPGDQPKDLPAVLTCIENARLIPTALQILLTQMGLLNLQ